MIQYCNFLRNMKVFIDNFTKKEVILALFLILFGCGNLFSQVDRTRAFEMNKRLGMGINFGLCYEAPSIGAWGVNPDPRFFKDIKARGFSHIRLPINWFSNASETAPYTINKSFMDTIRWSINTCIANGLITIINIHNFDPIMYNPPSGGSSLTSRYEPNFLAFWEQIANEFKDYPTDSLIFELLNEPHNDMTEVRWNTLLQRGLATVRETNPDRIVLIASANWGGAAGLRSLVLPDDPYLITEVHFYDPMEFTHQGSAFQGTGGTMNVTWTGSPQQMKAMRDTMNVIRTYSQQHNIPIHIGEFGVVENAPYNSRVLWLDSLCSIFREYDFSGAYWEYLSGFGIYNSGFDCYRTCMLKALLPDKSFEDCVDCCQFDTVLVKNGSLDIDWTYWGFFLNSGNGNIAIVDGEAKIHIIQVANSYWEIQFYATPFQAYQGNNYVLTFDAHASNNNTVITAEMTDMNGYSAVMGYNYTLSTTKQTFTTVMNNFPRTCNLRITFEMGSVQSGRDIYIDNVHMYNMSKGPNLQLCNLVCNTPDEGQESSVIGVNTESAKCMIEVGDHRFAVNGNVIRQVIIYDTQGKKCFQKVYDANHVTIENASIPKDVSLIEVKTDLKREILKYVKP